MTPDIEIINLPVSRWKEYRNLRLESLKEEPQAFGTKFSDAQKRPDDEWIGILTAAQKEDKDILFFAQDKGKLVGITGSFFNKTPDKQGIGTIYGVYVNAAYRGMGVGQQLLKKVLERLKANPTIKKARLLVSKDQKEAIKLYEKIGFVAVGTDKFLLGDGIEHEEFIMEIQF